MSTKRLIQLDLGDGAGPREFNATALSGHVADDFELATTCKEDEKIGDVSIVAEDKVDLTLSGEISSIDIEIPENIQHGYCSGINFRSQDTAPSVRINNLSAYQLNIIVNGVAVEEYMPKINSISEAVIYCNGISVTCIIVET